MATARRPRKTVKKAPESAVEAPAKAPDCLVPDCTREGSTWGLCDAHWMTHRGLARIP